MPKQIPLHQLLESLGRQIAPTLRTEILGDAGFTDTTGFHIYGELNLTLKLTAATDTQDARKLLQVLREYTLIAEACAAESSAALLEVQGERIHLLMPATEVNATTVSEVLRFCMAFTDQVYSRIKKAAGAEFGGFKMAVDHGRAILVASGQSANGSVISLGPAANAPAKELKRNGKAAHLRMRSKHYACVQTPPNTQDWVDVPILNPSAALANLASKELSGRFGGRSDQFIRENLGDLPEVTYASPEFLNKLGAGYVRTAIKVQGFALRADLDGFSKQVEAAFAAGDAAILLLVQKFVAIMNYPAQFRAQIGQTVDMPWAGDCATVIVLPGVCSYEDAREFLPAKAAATWHSQRGGADASKRKWADYVGSAKWAVGVAGGDDQEGANGYILIAPVAGRNRDFLIAAGWGIGRSLDAQESDGVAGDDTVVHDIDYAALDTVHRKTFKSLTSIFWISHGLTTAGLRGAGVSELAASAPVFAPSIAKPIPQPRPWYGNPNIS